MKKYFLPALLLLMSGVFAATIDRNTVVVQERSAILTERNAAEILADTLGRMFGSPVKVISAGEYDGRSPAVFLKSAPLAPDEWCIEATSPGVVTISGGRTLGVLFGTYEFLEKFGKCRYFAPKCFFIPQCRSFCVPDGKRFQRSPFFLRRAVAASNHNPENARFNSWHKANNGFCAFNENLIPLEQEYIFKTQRMLGGDCHTLFFWSKDFPSGHPEYFSMDSEGKRLRATSTWGPGQLCFSHPDVRRLMKEKVLSALREDRENAKKYGFPPAATVNITHNDNHSYCVCPGCTALLKKYGRYSGVLLDFINDIASCAPDVTFETFAYMFTEEPPQGIRPAPNVSMYLAFLGTDLGGKCDTARPLESHSNNAETRRFIREWGKISHSISSWLYQRQFSQEFPSPFAMVWNIAPDLRYLGKMGVNRLFVESEFYDGNRLNPRSLHDLHEYVLRKLMDDPYQDENVLIREFMTYYYGPAEPEMTEYMNYLRKRLDEEKRMLGKVAVHDRAYMDTAFLVTINRLLTQAQSKIAGDPLRSTHIAADLMLVDSAAANMWLRLPDLPQKYGLTVDEMLDRLEKNGLIALDLAMGGPVEEKNLPATRKRLHDKVVFFRTQLKNSAENVSTKRK